MLLRLWAWFLLPHPTRSFPRCARNVVESSCSVFGTVLFWCVVLSPVGLETLVLIEVVVSLVRWWFGLVVFVSVVCGVVLTLVSGFCQRNLSDRIGVSVVGYGLPLSWYTTSWVVYPTSPVLSSYVWQSFAIDTTFWAITAFAIIMAVLTLLKPKKECIVGEAFFGV